jgi:hypothetical protein
MSGRYSMPVAALASRTGRSERATRKTIAKLVAPGGPAHGLMWWGDPARTVVASDLAGADLLEAITDRADARARERDAKRAKEGRR